MDSKVTVNYVLVIPSSYITGYGRFLTGYLDSRPIIEIFVGILMPYKCKLLCNIEKGSNHNIFL